MRVLVAVRARLLLLLLLLGLGRLTLPVLLELVGQVAVAVELLKMLMLLKQLTLVVRLEMVQLLLTNVVVVVVVGRWCPCKSCLIASLTSACYSSTQQTCLSGSTFDRCSANPVQFALPRTKT
jgi:hypothetical protein